MKRVIGFVIFLFVVGLIYQFVVVHFENNFEFSYDLSSGNRNFSILEEYKKDKYIDGYYVTITSDDGYEFVFYVDNNFNKQKKIIDEVFSYEEDDYLCIYPKAINDSDEFEILCSDKDQIYSYEYLNNKIDLNSFISTLKLNNYFVDDVEETNDVSGTTFYINNIYDSEYFMIYRYKYLTMYNNGISKDLSFSSSDIYKNELGVYINNYFVVPSISNNKVEKYYIIDCINMKESVIKFDNALSDNLYNIGILDDNLYVFDLDNKIEYEIDPENATYEVIGNTDSGFSLYKDGEWVEESVTSFVKEKVTFSDSVKLDFDYEYDSFYEVENAYYILDGNKLYKIYKNDYSKRILLLELNNYSNLVVAKDRVYYLQNEYIYRCDKYGIKRLVSNNEFKYNNTNIFSIYNE